MASSKAVELTSVMDVEDVPLRLLNGWRPRVYRLQPGPLRLTRRFLEIAPGLSIQELRLQSGGIRIDGRLEPGTLKIGFIRGKEIRIPSLQKARCPR